VQRCPHCNDYKFKISRQIGVTMKNDLPYLDQKRLNTIFDHVYDDVVDKNVIKLSFEDEKFYDFFEMLKSMQLFNYRHRCSDTHDLFLLLHPDVFDFEINSEGTTVWLSLILAIKDLYGFSDKKLVSVIKQVTVRR
jgi:hypothetical protein